METVSTDLGVFMNCPSREGMHYVQKFTNYAHKFVTAYGLRVRMFYTTMLIELEIWWDEKHWTA